MLEEQRTAYRGDRAAALKAVSVGDAPRDSALDPVEHAAWAALCLALFNLDEALTRE
jgi:hypothetical protein